MCQLLFLPSDCTYRQRSSLLLRVHRWPSFLADHYTSMCVPGVIYPPSLACRYPRLSLFACVYVCRWLVLSVWVGGCLCPLTVSPTVSWLAVYVAQITLLV